MSKTKQHDENIRLMLSCNVESEIQQGFMLIEQHFRDSICGWLKRCHYPGIPPEDLSDLWQDSIRELLNQVREGKYDGERKIASDLCRLMKTNADDRLRRKGASNRLILGIGNAFKGTQTGKKWQQTDLAEKRELQALIRDAAADKLTDAEKQVLDARIRNFPEGHDLKTLRQFVSEVSGKEETMASVKGSLRRMRAKLRPILRRKGYEIPQAGDADE